MTKAVGDGLACLSIVLGTGFVPGPFQVPFFRTTQGESRAKLAGKPIVETVIVVAAGAVRLERWMSVTGLTPDCLRLVEA